MKRALLIGVAAIAGLLILGAMAVASANGVPHRHGPQDNGAWRKRGKPLKHNSNTNVIDNRGLSTSLAATGPSGSALLSHDELKRK